MRIPKPTVKGDAFGYWDVRVNGRLVASIDRESGTLMVWVPKGVRPKRIAVRPVWAYVFRGAVRDEDG
jgi:hypothetical protein